MTMVIRRMAKVMEIKTSDRTLLTNGFALTCLLPAAALCLLFF